MSTRMPAYRLPLHARLLYASGSLGSQAVLQALLLWTIFFYSTPNAPGLEPLLPIGLVGILVFFSRIADIVSDPLVGHWSHGSRSRWGRRIPFIVMGTPVMTLGFLLVWMPPLGVSSELMASYLVAALCIFLVGHTISGRPYDALLPEPWPVTCNQKVARQIPALC